jgi:hypothetical protein
MKKELVLFIAVVLLGNVVFAQSGKEITEKEIITSGNYFCGEGFRDSIADAKQDAVMDLQYKISVNLTSASESQVKENDDGISSSYSKNIKMFSTIKLKGLQFFIKKRSDEKYHVVAYISKEDYKKMVEEIKSDVTDRVKLAETTEKERGLVNAAPMYYDAYLYTYFSPEPISYNSITYRQAFSNVRVFLETKVRSSYLAELEISQDSILVDPSTPELIVVNLNVAYLKLPVDNVELSFNLPGNPKQKVNNGKAKLFLYSQPSAIKEDYELNINIFFDGSSDISDFNDEFPIMEKQKISLDFSKLVKFDFKVKKLPDGSLQFEPVIKNLSVSTIEWNFGKDAVSTDTKAIYNFGDDKSHTVSLTVNGLKKMKVVKKIDPTGKILENEYADYTISKNKIPPIITELIKNRDSL